MESSNDTSVNYIRQPFTRRKFRN